MSRYLTKLGREGSGIAVNSKPGDAFRYKHDILLRAADEGLDVYMLCSCLNRALREHEYFKATQRSFAEDVREVLVARHDVSILVWDEVKDGLVATSLLDLAREATSRRMWGKLDIRFSGTTEESENLSHFTIAKSRDDQRWLLRVEEPHKRYFDGPEACDAEVPAAIFFDSEDAKRYGEPLLKVFHEMFDAVPDREIASTATA